MVSKLLLKLGHEWIITMQTILYFVIIDSCPSNRWAIMVTKGIGIFHYGLFTLHLIPIKITACYDCWVLCQKQVSRAGTNNCAPNILWHYGDVINSLIASQIPSLTIVYSTVNSDADQRKHQSSRHWLCVGNSPMTAEFPAQRASNAENISIWWRHHDMQLHVPVPDTCFWHNTPQLFW